MITFQDLPGDLKVKIININKEAERDEFYRENYEEVMSETIDCFVEVCFDYGYRSNNSEFENTHNQSKDFLRELRSSR